MEFPAQGQKPGVGRRAGAVLASPDGVVAAADDRSLARAGMLL
jgi:hypothetical protein